MDGCKSTLTQHYAKVMIFLRISIMLTERTTKKTKTYEINLKYPTLSLMQASARILSNTSDEISILH